jgi:hypothetical protein
MTSPILTSGSEAMASLASQVIQYTGGDTRLGRRVRFGAAVTFLALALRSLVVIGVSGPPCSKKRNAIHEDLRKVGKAVVAGDVAESKDDCDGDFDEYDVIVVGGGTHTSCKHHESIRLAVSHWGAQIVLRYRGLHPGIAPQRKPKCARSVAGSGSKVRSVPDNLCLCENAFPVL